jgi:peptide/nickel transport system substrate-binding protein
MDLAGYEDGESHADDNSNTSWSTAWDPQVTFSSYDPFELFRCCLLRNLLSYSGHSVQLGGAELKPDLAAALPMISPDGLTWTFSLKPGIHYAPPMADKEIVAADFVRAIERTLRPDPTWTDPTTPAAQFGPIAAQYLDVIAGASDFSAGKAASISGLETPDDVTLVIHLLQSTGDLGARLALPAFAPLPAGAADGHDKDYGQFLVASGPYMIEGSDALNPSLPAAQQPTVTGYVPGDHLYLVRNPSWDRSTDELRGAFADRIEITNVADPDVLTSAIQSDQIDVSLSTNLSAPELASLRSDKAWAPRVHSIPGLISKYINLNLAVPPFDDIHVRRAVQLATDKRAIDDLVLPGSTVQNHVVPDGLENGLLDGYSPYATGRESGDLAAAKVEMAQSPYDSNHDGICDNQVCQNIAMDVPFQPPNDQAAATFAANVAGIGLQLVPDVAPQNEFYGPLVDPTQHMPVGFDSGWSNDYFGAANWFAPLATDAKIGPNDGSNFTLVGATTTELTQWGYSVTSAPSVDSNVAECSALSGADAFGCWSRVDQYLMQRVAALVPLATAQSSRLVSSSVTSFDFDSSLALPALAQIEVAP